MNNILANLPTQLWILLDILIAALLTGLIGLEREVYNKPAGLRTNMIVGSISCFFVSISAILIADVRADTDFVKVVSDPVRIIDAIIVGVSFIGAGTIIKSSEGNTVRNLTTAATLLYSAGIGLSVSLKQYVISVGLCILILTINWLIHSVESRLPNSKRSDSTEE